jgi:hypothetical protein
VSAKPAASRSVRRAATAPQQLKREVEMALEARRQELIEKCWKALDAGTRVPRVHWTLEYVFDAQGKMLGSGLRESRDAADADVTRCFQKTVTELRISPPGAGARVEVEFWLPEPPS